MFSHRLTEVHLRGMHIATAGGSDLA